VTFQNRDLAWQELLRRDPDLLITDLNNENVPGQPGYTGMIGRELLPLLAQRKVKYPLMIVSGSLRAPGVEGQVRDCAGPALNLTLLAKPFAAAAFENQLVRLLSDSSS
jgi:CheY-like chemotaxis protein